MEPIEVIGQKLTFVAPSGTTFTIREQNGADDDVLSNARTAKNLMNLSYFIAGIVTETDATPSRKLTAQDALKLPVLDRYCILLNSRIFSLGQTLDFVHDWGKENGGEVNYEQDLEEFLFDYAEIPSAEVLASKPDAIPFYPNGRTTKDLTFRCFSKEHLMWISKYLEIRVPHFIISSRQIGINWIVGRKKTGMQMHCILACGKSIHIIQTRCLVGG